MTGAAALPACVLEDAVAESYLSRTAALLREARLGAQFPAGRALLANLHALSARCHRGLYSQLHVDPASGLPALREWTRVLTDVQLAPQVLAGLPALAQLRERAPRDPAYGKQLLKALYYSELLQGPPPPIEQLAVALQKVDAQAGTVQVQVALDKLDVRGLLVRCTVELVQGPSSRPLVTRDGDRVAAAPELQALLYRLAGHDAELLFIELATQPGVQPRRVCIGTVGPLHLTELPRHGELAQLLAGPGAALASFATDLAACELPEGRNNDPLAALFAERLSAQARSEYEQTRQRLGYHVAKDRKFVADSQTVRALGPLCERAGTRNVIYALRATT